jgi:uroporphyrinogen-III synthase
MIRDATTARVLLVRSASTPDQDADALRANGFDVTPDPYLTIATCDDAGAPARAQAVLDALLLSGAWLICASAMAIRALDDLVGPATVSRCLVEAEVQGARFAAVGPTSGTALRERGVSNVLAPVRRHTASALLDALKHLPPGIAVLPRSDIADGVIPATLQARGWSLMPQVLYRTMPVDDPPASLAALSSGHFDAIVLRSPSAARAVRSFAPALPERTRVVCGGPTTALAARRLGFEVHATATLSGPADIAEALLVTLEARHLPTPGSPWS